MRNRNNGYQRVKFERKDNPKGLYDGVILDEDHESCTIGVDFEGTEATIVCYYDEWSIIKI